MVQSPNEMQVNMHFIKKAEKRNKERSKMHRCGYKYMSVEYFITGNLWWATSEQLFFCRFFRRKDWLIAGICFSMVRKLLKKTTVLKNYFHYHAGDWDLWLHHLCDTAGAILG